MRNGWLRFATIALILAVGAGCVAGADKEQVFVGEIGDSQCSLDVHSVSRSHQEMLEKGNVGKTPADCARYCVKEMGGVFVLQVKDKVYKLDNQELADKYAGMKVRLVGVLDPSTSKISVHSIEPVK
jgi:Protein of unknown function (DUF5818)